MRSLPTASPSSFHVVQQVPQFFLLGLEVALIDLVRRNLYRHLLDDAQYFTMTFIRGPVCRGQVAVDVIEDHFFVSYLDPGSGSMILQMIAGGTAALAVTAKLYWRRVLKFLRIRKSDDD